MVFWGQHRGGDAGEWRERRHPKIEGWWEKRHPKSGGWWSRDGGKEGGGQMQALMSLGMQGHRDVRPCACVGCAHVHVGSYNTSRGARAPQILTQGGAKQGQSRENKQTEGRVRCCDRGQGGDTPQETPVYPFIGRAGVWAGVGKPLSPPRAPQQPRAHPTLTPTLTLGCNSPGWQGSARSQRSLVPAAVWDRGDTSQLPARTGGLAGSPRSPLVPHSRSEDLEIPDGTSPFPLPLEPSPCWELLPLTPQVFGLCLQQKRRVEPPPAAPDPPAPR